MHLVGFIIRIKLGIKETEWKDINQIHLPQNKDKLRALAKTVMKYHVP